ncbi:PREDICTED: uncharacterized protein LOC108380658, partial [Rhagoletis zephyria]|uniref:uncharacterized protein LOC108380658 n=1 Tax=Rhagoletis zephyria TaxID=28612 RepID=UPI0008115A36
MACIKVPPCDTEVFYGGYEDWPSFRDMFTAVYLNHPKLTPAQKLYHLRNKTRAWEALRARYENKQMLADNQLKTLFSLPAVNSENSEAIQRIQTTINDCLSSLNSLGVPVANWDPILIYFCSTKLPEETLSLWEHSLKSRKELPLWSHMNEFLTSRYEVLERLNSIRSTKNRHSFPQRSNEIQAFHSKENLSFKCKLCSNPHSLKVCYNFRQLSVPERKKFVEENGYCVNCLAYNHVLKDCQSTFKCFQCKRSHHTLLHSESNPPNKSYAQRPMTQSANHSTSLLHTQSAPSTPTQSDETQSKHPIFELSQNISPTTDGAPAVVQANFSSNNETTLLPTAVVHVEHLGELYSLRAFIDQGSQKTFISERSQKRLQLPTTKENFSITGMGGSMVENVNRVCKLVLVSKKTNTRIEAQAIVLHKLTSFLPTFHVKKPSLAVVTDLDLADPKFFNPSQIDIVLGSDLMPQILLEGVKHNVFGNLLAQNSIFGWYLSGPMKREVLSSFHTHVVEDNSESINSQLKKFWEIEELPDNQQPSEDDIFCETFFVNTTYRQHDGRYVVRLPFKSTFPCGLSLGRSRFQAMKQALRMEHTLNKNPSLKEEYTQVLEEYLTLDHMKPTSSEEMYDNGTYQSFYLPHHSVIRAESKSTK